MSSGASQGADPRKAELVLAQLDALPPLAPIVARILSLTGNDKTHGRQIVELVSADPALSARMLSIANRAENGLRNKAVTIDAAVTLLGFNAVRQITLAAKVMEQVGPASGTCKESAFDRTEFWRHCLAVACAARLIALMTPKFGSPDEAFVYGLLHDIGKIAIETAMPKSFERIVTIANDTRGDISDVERQIIGIDHALAGRRLAEKWGLPRKLIECIWLHHQHPEGLPASIASSGHVQIVQLADTLAREQRIGYSGNHRIQFSSRLLAPRLGLSEKQRGEIVATLGDEIDRRAVWIGLENLNTRQVHMRALIDNVEELSAANAQLLDESRRRARDRQYLSAFQRLSAEVTPEATVRDVCATAAAVLSDLVEVARVRLCVWSDGWIEWGDSQAGARTGFLERTTDAESDEIAALQMAQAGLWLLPPAGAHAALANQWSIAASNAPAWLLPIVRDRQWIGAALFSAGPERIGALRAESDRLEAISGAIGLAIEQARARTAAMSFADELAEANRRLGAAESQLLEAKNLETMVTLAAGAAHELNNPLAVMAGRAQMLLRREVSPDVRESLEIIARQAQACSSIVTEMMEFARSPEPRPGPVQLGSCIARIATELTTAGLLDAAQITIEIGSNTPAVLLDDAHLHGIFREVLRNAIDATDPAERRLCVKTPPQAAENGVVVQVIDNGRGMTADVLDRAMEPFFSDRPAGRARGMGLARVQRWLQQGGGAIRLDSEPGKGTVVELRLPRA